MIPHRCDPDTGQLVIERSKVHTNTKRFLFFLFNKPETELAEAEREPTEKSNLEIEESNLYYQIKFPASGSLSKPSFLV